MSTENIYGNRIRNRVMGICIENDRILLVKHKHIGNPHFWCPVGGGVELFETAQNALKREFLEESNLEISVGKLLFVHEFIQKPFHAIEFFFEVKIIGGNLEKGYDPELDLIEAVSWLSFEELAAQKTGCKHQIFEKISSFSQLWEIETLV